MDWVLSGRPRWQVSVEIVIMAQGNIVQSAFMSIVGA